MTIGMPRLICEVVEHTLCWMNPVKGFRAILLSAHGAAQAAHWRTRISEVIYIYMEDPHLYMGLYGIIWDYIGL